MTVTIERIKEVFQPVTKDISNPRARRVFLTVPRTDLIKATNILASELGVQHLSTITALDTGTVFEVLYHFFIDGIVLTVRTTCPRDDPAVDSIIAIYPSAVLYEREIHDVLGIVPVGHPDLRKLVLPENWTDGNPLRKDWKPTEAEA